MAASDAFDGGTSASRPAPEGWLARAIHRNGAGYMFLAPWLIGFFCLTLGPALVSLYLSFTDFDLLTSPEFIGAQNYVRMVTEDAKFAAAIKVTLVYVALSVPLKLAFALAIAMVLNRGMRALPAYRAIFYLPSLLGTSVAIAVLWRQLFAADGLVNSLLAMVGIEGPSWISNPNYSLYTLVVLSVWQFGSPMIIFLAGLRQIPADMYEAASLDGASPRRQFLRITLPLLSPVIFFNFVIQTIEAFKAFTPAFVISGGSGGPLKSTYLLPMYIYDEAFRRFDMGYASTLAWVLFVIIMVLTLAAFWSSKKWVYYAGDKRS
ncbi:sugar ABC transporter permease (plasmid) [Salipiger sp. H15]|uniref:Sugar ABC transporter permease n=1 Tax=Alloyangia sp. H15 TaxID=3029062 RepID=A0AAU8ASM0_9RHOB